MAENKKKGFSLADALSGVSKLDTGNGGREQIEYINIDRIHQDERNFYELPGIPELAANIEFAGLQQPLRVRPDPEQPGYYILVSGHRRHAAMTLLAKEGNQRFWDVACIVEQPSGQTSKVESMLQELRLIYGNSDTRKLTSADISKQAERVEMLLYQLKEEGYEFPGRMRDHVAEACKVSKSKLARLKVIRENLIKDLKKSWESGNLRESVAYAFARQTPEVQRLTVLSITRYGAINTERRWWQEWQVKDKAGAISRELEPKKGPKGSCESCDATEQRIKRISAHSQYEDHCNNGKCCHCCPNIGTCEFVCSHLSDEVAKAKVAAQAKKAAEKEKKQAADEKHVAPTVRLWKRFGDARAAAGLTFEEYAKKADVRGFIREKKVADFEQGRKITPSSGGLPYAGGNGVDEWRIRPLIKAADALGCSIDYLLCRTDNPQGMGAAPQGEGWITLTWIDGFRPPHEPRHAVAIFDCEGTHIRQLVYWDGEVWRFKPGGPKLDAKCLHWFPVPEEDAAAAGGVRV